MRALGVGRDEDLRINGISLGLVAVETHYRELLLYYTSTNLVITKMLPTYGSQVKDKERKKHKRRKKKRLTVST